MTDPEPPPVHWIDIHSDRGIFTAAFTPIGLSRLRFPRGNGLPTRDTAESADTPPPEWIQVTTDAVLAVLRGIPAESLPPLDLRRATDFQRRVWDVLLSLPVSATTTYGAIAAQLGNPGAARAVGAACGANPIPLLIPCHRVLAAGGGLGGFSGGLHWKTRLLELEHPPLLSTG